MKVRNLFWMLVVTLSCAVVAYGKENPEATVSYEKAVKQLKSGDLSIDFKALRVNCSQSKYSCRGDSDVKKELTNLLNTDKFDEALEEVNKALDKTFVDIDLHYMAFIANMESGHKDKAEFHRSMIRGLLDSIQENKKGRSTDDAFEVINVNEEYVFLNFSNMRVKSQSLLEKAGHSYDVIVCTDMALCANNSETPDCR